MKISLILLIVLFPIIAAAQEYGNSITSKGTTVYEDGTVSVRQGDNTFYNNGRVDTKLPDTNAEIIYIPEGERDSGFTINLNIDNEQ